MKIGITRNAEYGLGLLRAVIGGVFLAHGWQLLFVYGHAGVAAGMAKSGIPAPEISAWLLSLTQFIGGALLLAGALTRIAALPVAFTMLVALFKVHLHNGFFITQNGFEYVLVLFTALAVLSIAGPGAFALDNVIGSNARIADSAPAGLRRTA